MFDEHGFDGDEALMAVRLGGDLRVASLVKTGPELEAFRRPGLLAQFLAAAKGRPSAAAAAPAAAH